MASVAVPPEADMVRIATAAGAPEPARRRYDGGRLHVDGIEQAALDAALAEIGTDAPQPVPRSITPRQARLALLDAGLLDAVEALVQQAPRAVQVEWEFGNEVERHSPIIASLAAEVPLTDAQLDDLFRTAAAL